MGKYDFSGWATRNDLLCGDGRTIRKNAFKDNDGKEVPLVWNHQHNDPDAVLGHAILENRDEGVYAYGVFNDTESGQMAKKLVQHGDVKSLSIWANQLKQIGGDVIHGNIRELSLVLAGANPGAFIDFAMAHGDGEEDTLIASYDENIMLYHSDEPAKEEKKEEKDMAEEKKDAPETKNKSIQDIIDSMTDEQKEVLYGLVGMAREEGAYEDDEEDDEEDGGKEMKHNLFENENENEYDVLSHDAMTTIINDGKRYGSLKESFLAHAENYGIKDIDWLFPDAKNLNTPPEFIKRDTGWVQKVMSGTHHTPFSRIKSMFADLREDEARARGYIKGNLKKEEVFSLLKRTTTPTTIYKKQKLDRDDIVDITDFDVVAWLKGEMRMMLDEEIARAILVGDGRLSSSDEKINEQNIRPIWTDADLYTIKTLVTLSSNSTSDDTAKAFIKAAIKSRKNYKGSGTPTLFTTEDVVTDCLLIEDTTGRRIYNSVTDLATALRVKEIVTVEVMEGLTRTVGSDTHNLMGIIVNLADYNVGADKGGAVNMFDDFDIDYNQQKYLIETRCSGALIKPYSAIAIESKTAAA